MLGITHINDIPFLIPSLVLMSLFYSRQEVGGKGGNGEAGRFMLRSGSDLSLLDFLCIILIILLGCAKPSTSRIIES